MTDQQPHTPTTELPNATLSVITNVTFETDEGLTKAALLQRTKYDSWLGVTAEGIEWTSIADDQIIDWSTPQDEIAAAEQRGAIKALREAADELFYDGDTDRPLPGYTELLDRADQIEGDDDSHDHDNTSC